MIMVGVYSVFVNEGQMYMLYFIMKIVDLIGVVIIDNINKKLKQVILKEIVDEMISMFFGIFLNGIVVVVNFVGYMIVGKIGIIEINFDVMKVND